ncbi:hypothetical protein Pla175_39440 [Pirellulimonas nuda]|uniref:DUF2062 domain-containing protein n=1 Tax=Pirellulimonas nuda TaxID=2528009 RepID=A0A518DGD8_9BACT|nr:TIGR03546 family protein [Pirellulimonas nuda]QDU90538.1 hypothetical protein Pla175_39440 [Pirellulimonas nuda]
MLGLVRPLRQLAGLFTAHDSPRQVAAGVAIGMVLGLVPKGNLIAVLLGMTLMVFRVNRTAGLLSAALFSWIGLGMDGFTDRLGGIVLAAPSMQGAYAWLYDLPLGPWIGFNNTVVLGSLLTGLYLSYPCYLLTHLVYARLQPPALRWIARYRLGRWLMGADWSQRLGLTGVLGVK